MDKRYQVFVSLTSDLAPERQAVQQSLLDLRCIPTGFESCPSADDDFWTRIKRAIDDCDYYLAIIGGNYGSSGPTEKSYAEMEYEYAISQKKPVIAFLHSAPATLPGAASQLALANERRLKEFRKLIAKRNHRVWKSVDDLRASVTVSLIQLMRDRPGRDRDREGIRVKRYSNLVDKKFAFGLSDTEQGELDQLSKLLDEEDESSYGPLKQALLNERDNLVKKKTQKHQQEH